MVDVVYRSSGEDSASHLERADYLLLVVEVAGTIPQLCGEGQDSVVGNRNPHACQLVNYLPLAHVCM